MNLICEVPMRIRGRGDVAHCIETVLTGWSGDDPKIEYHTTCGITGPLGHLHSGVGYEPCPICWPGVRMAA